MTKKINCVLLIDDNPADNYYHHLIIKEMEIAESIMMLESGIDALEYLKKQGQVAPELIFLDLNMPRMNGWEFIEHYKKLDAAQKAKAIILILTTSANPDDWKRAKEIEEVTGIETKPLNPEMMKNMIKLYFQDKL